MPLFVAFEGLPGTGKTTAIEKIKKDLKRNGFKAVISDIETIGDAPRLRAIAGKYPPGHPAKILLFWILRIQQYDFAMENLGNADVVIADRFWGSTLAFDVYGNMVPEELMRWVKGYIKIWPDITFFFDAPLGVAIKRKESGTMKDIKFARRAEKGYLALAEKLGWVRVDASLSPEKVEKICLDIILGELL